MDQSQTRFSTSFALDLNQDPQPVRSQGSWSVPWSDLMMVMFILFLVLFIFHAKEREVFIPGAFLGLKAGSSSTDRVDLNLDPLYQQARKSLGTNSSVVASEIDSKGDLIISLFGPTFFNSGSTDLNPQSEYYLERISEIVSLAQGGVVVSGFADKNEESSNPWETSAIRASKISMALVDKGQIRKENVVVKGYGTNKPLVPDDRTVSKERNRRVEIRILK
ncbi:MAG: flagellar motor protein MotB [Desulfonatronovibrio sp.]